MLALAVLWRQDAWVRQVGIPCGGLGHGQIEFVAACIGGEMPRL